MGSTCHLSREHFDAQQEHLRLTHEYMRDLLLFDVDKEKDLGLHFSPGEGHAVEHETNAFDLMGAYHDVVPFECLSAVEQVHFHNGSESNAAAISNRLIDILDIEGLRVNVPPSREGFSMLVERPDGTEHVMPVHVVNVVNTSYWTIDRYGEEVSPVLLPHRFMWRRLAYMGCQVNHVRTSIKICYGWPWNATELISHPGRILETGADNHVTANLMFHHVTLKSFQRAGMPHLYVTDRSLRNVVTTTNMPLNGAKVSLPLLYHQLQQHMRTSYVPDKFAGVIVHHPNFKKVRGLIFDRGAVVIVGTTSEEQTIEALESLRGAIFSCEESPETLAVLAALGPEIRRLCDVSQKVVTHKRAAIKGQLVPSGSGKKARFK